MSLYGIPVVQNLDPFDSVYYTTRDRRTQKRKRDKILNSYQNVELKFIDC